MKRIIGLVIILILSLQLVACISGDDNMNQKSINLSNYHYTNTDIKVSKHLYVIKEENIKGYSEKILIQTLQGVLAQEKAEIYLVMNDAYELWLTDLAQNYGITYEYVNSVWDLVDKYKQRINDQYVLYFENIDSVNIACTYAGLEGVIAISTDIEEIAIQHGLTLKKDVTNETYEWLLETYENQINWDFIIQQVPTNPANRDLGVAKKGIFLGNMYSNIDGKYYSEKIKALTPMIGWGPTDEGSDVGFRSGLDMTTIPADHSYNFTILSGITEKNFIQNVDKSEIKVEENKHYVTFVLSDGDNVQWMMGNDYYLHKDRYANSNRGSIPFGWSIAPSMYDLAPTVLKKYYDNATGNDYFYSGVSGLGYFFPNKMSDEALQEHAQKLNEYFKRLDLDYVTIMGYNGFNNNPDSLKYYADETNIDGGFIFSYHDKYEGYHGKLWWFNNKPFVAVRNALWEVDDLEAFAEKINNYETNPYVINGYTVVVVHCWSHSFDDVVKVIDQFDEHVQVVNPYQFMKMIEKNIPKVDDIP